MTHHIFYDTETTGPEPAFDQVLQFAGILTDDDFNEIETIDVRSRLAGHIIPTPGALRVTHVDPYDIARAPYSAYEFSRYLHKTLTDWSSNGVTSFAGFNSIRFDEEIMRQLFWQSLQDPYLTSGAKKMRNDYLITLRALHARNPEVIDFPINPATGKKSFKLEIIAPANGFEGHNAHDALGDVRATIFAARLIRDVDPHLYEHMLAMGNANQAKEFVEDNIVFQLLGGPMLNPGVLDVCLVGSEASNPKNKTAWNLAIDPVPYLDMSPEELLSVMKTPGTPFRAVKCAKQPGVFPMDWGFLNRVTTEDYAPADAATIDERADIIREHTAFRRATEEALALKTNSYEPEVHLEKKIYSSGFPSWDDKKRMANFHTLSDWEQRYDAVLSMEKPELRAHGRRVIFSQAPEVLSETMRTQIDQRLAQERFTLESDRPWTTLGTVMKELDTMLEETPEDPEVLNIRKWFLETYPVTHEWEAYKAEQAAKAEAAEKAALEAQELSEPEDQADPEAKSSPEEASQVIPAQESELEPAMEAPRERSVAAVAVSYLDGIE